MRGWRLLALSRGGVARLLLAGRSWVSLPTNGLPIPLRALVGPGCPGVSAGRALPPGLGAHGICACQPATLAACSLRALKGLAPLGSTIGYHQLAVWTEGAARDNTRDSLGSLRAVEGRARESAHSRALYLLARLKRPLPPPHPLHPFHSYDTERARISVLGGVWISIRTSRSLSDGARPARACFLSWAASHRFGAVHDA